MTTKNFCTTRPNVSDTPDTDILEAEKLNKFFEDVCRINEQHWEQIEKLMQQQISNTTNTKK
jgi:hypothetical protein